MSTKDETDREFQLEVIERLTRIETKQDSTNGIVKKNCEDIGTLQKKDIVRDTQWSLLKKLGAGGVTILGVSLSVLTFLIASHII